jgi:hypothetical protein
MALQDDVNAQVAVIRNQLDAAQAVTLPDAVTVSFEAIRMALSAAADAVDALGGDGSGIRGQIDRIEDAALSLAEYNNAVSSHLAATSGMIDLLITNSHFDGNVE